MTNPNKPPASGDEGYMVDLEHLDATTARISGLVGFLTESLAGLDARMSGVHQTWTGDAASAHAAAHAEWKTSAQDAQDGIDRMRAAAEAAHGHYSDNLAANLRILGR
ncbi:WXG100 family type VII secretion target [Nocardia wallacei]|uniref:WXG100 family type VII secretion target n=1 Tax=Nocardia wallacei TaxID=480035 RepID=UPI002455F5C0|nr:WXG100 family type VII secretion target [Nocardia wallacei]